MQVQVQDILNAIANVQRLIIGTTFTEFVSEEAIAKALLYKLIIIGEAYANASSDV